MSKKKTSLHKFNNKLQAKLALPKKNPNNGLNQDNQTTIIVNLTEEELNNLEIAISNKTTCSRLNSDNEDLDLVEI